MSAATAEKARRIRAEGRLRELDARTFGVQGAHGAYLVAILSSGSAICTCPARGECSHIRAATDQIAAETEER